MLVSYVPITLYLRNQKLQPSPLTPSEANLAEFSHGFISDAASTAASIYHFLQMIIT
jgi:hypothetical protein